MLISSMIELCVIHFSDTTNNRDLKASDIHRMHLCFGCDGIGYYKLICRSGKIKIGTK